MFVGFCLRLDSRVNVISWLRRISWLVSFDPVIKCTYAWFGLQLNSSVSVIIDPVGTADLSAFTLLLDISMCDLLCS